MSALTTQRYAWGILWHACRGRENEQRYLLGRFCAHAAADSMSALAFATKREAKAWIRGNYGYIAKRPDLRAAPHYWTTPTPIRIRVTVEEV